MEAVFPPLLQLIVYGAVPLVISTTALPLQSVEHVGFVPCAETVGSALTVTATTTGGAGQVPVGVKV